MHLLVKFGIDQPFARGEPAVAAGLQRRLVHGGGEQRDLLLGEKGVVRPLHELVPDFGIVPAVEVDLLVEKGQSLQGRHRPEDIPLSVDDAHQALLVDIARRLLVKPDEVQRASLKALPALIAALEADHARPAQNVPDDDLVDDARGGIVLSAADHDDIRNLIGTQVIEHLFLRDVALHLHGGRDDPAEHVLPVLAVGMTPARHPHRLHRTALRLARAIAAEHPAVALFTLVEGELFFVLFSARIVVREMVRRPPPGDLRLHRSEFYR